MSLLRSLFEDIPQIETWVDKPELIPRTFAQICFAKGWYYQERETEKTVCFFIYRERLVWIPLIIIKDWTVDNKKGKILFYLPKDFIVNKWLTEFLTSKRERYILQGLRRQRTLWEGGFDGR